MNTRFANPIFLWRDGNPCGSMNPVIFFKKKPMITRPGDLDWANRHFSPPPPGLMDVKISLRRKKRKIEEKTRQWWLHRVIEHVRVPYKRCPRTVGQRDRELMRRLGTILSRYGQNDLFVTGEFAALAEGYTASYDRLEFFYVGVNTEKREIISALLDVFRHDAICYRDDYSEGGEYETYHVVEFNLLEEEKEGWFPRHFARLHFIRTTAPTPRMRVYESLRASGMEDFLKRAIISCDENGFRCVTASPAPYHRTDMVNDDKVLEEYDDGRPNRNYMKKLLTERVVNVKEPLEVPSLRTFAMEALL